MSANRLKILLTTDNHLGYLERDPERGNDSFLAMEEILRLALTQQVDMILMGGDLFHDNNPSRKTLHRTMSLLSQYCLGDAPCFLEYEGGLEDQSVSVNFANPNVNIGLPIFSIQYAY